MDDLNKYTQLNVEDQLIQQFTDEITKGIDREIVLNILMISYKPYIDQIMRESKIDSILENSPEITKEEIVDKILTEREYISHNYDKLNNLIKEKLIEYINKL